MLPGEVWTEVNAQPLSSWKRSAATSSVTEFDLVLWHAPEVLLFKGGHFVRLLTCCASGGTWPYRLSQCNREEIMTERGLAVDHA